MERGGDEREMDIEGEGGDEREMEVEGEGGDEREMEIEGGVEGGMTWME